MKKLILRRALLKFAGASVALPFLESIPTNATHSSPPRRLVCAAVALGMHPDSWQPSDVGANFRLSPLLQPLKGLENAFSIVSGLDHPSVSGGHRGVPAFLSGTYRLERIGKSVIVRNSATFDQVVAKATGEFTRFASLQLSSSPYARYDTMVSWNDKGVALPAEGNAQKIFSQLFLQEHNPKQRLAYLQQRSSVLDFIASEANDLKKIVSSEDGATLERYMQSVRDVEVNIQRNQRWLDTPKPQVKALDLEPLSYHQNLDLVLEMMALAIETDSTRVISLDITQRGYPLLIKGHEISNYHYLSHHGKEPERLDMLVAVEREHMKSISRFMRRLQQTKEGDSNLLDQTTILFGAGMGNGSSHSNRNLPIMVAGGGMRHGKHHKFEKQIPLCNLFVSLMQNSGLETEVFADSTGHFNELFS